MTTLLFLVTDRSTRSLSNRPYTRVPGVIQVQIIQEELRRFRLRVVYIGTRAWSHACHQLTAAMRSVLGADVLITIEGADLLSLAPSAAWAVWCP